MDGDCGKDRCLQTRWLTSASSRSPRPRLRRLREFHESLSICRAERVTHTLVWAVEGLAAVALARGAPAVATRLLAATGWLRTQIGIAEGYYTVGDEVRERTLKDALELLGEAAFATVWAGTANLSLEELADEAALVD